MFAQRSWLRIVRSIIVVAKLAKSFGGPHSESLGDFRYGTNRTLIVRTMLTRIIHELVELVGRLLWSVKVPVPTSPALTPNEACRPMPTYSYVVVFIPPAVEPGEPPIIIKMIVRKFVLSVAAP